MYLDMKSWALLPSICSKAGVVANAKMSDFIPSSQFSMAAFEL
jgi:hypothetical protein